MYKKESVKGFEEYKIDTNGVAYSKRGKPLKYSINHNGYRIVNFYVNGKRKGFALHTLTAKQFVENNDPNKWQVNHKDGDKENNNYLNLEWCTPKENTKHAIDTLLINNSGGNNPNARSVGAYDKNENLIYTFDSISNAAKFIGNHKCNNYRAIQNCIWKAANGILKTYKGFAWNYL